MEHDFTLEIRKDEFGGIVHVVLDYLDDHHGEGRRFKIQYVPMARLCKPI
jgi:hypothetical protein